MSEKPEIIQDYNSTKEGVDALDEKCRNYTTSRRIRRWPMAISYAVLDIAGVNSYVLYKGQPNDNATRRDFLIQLEDQLVLDYMKTRLDTSTS